MKIIKTLLIIASIVLIGYALFKFILFPAYLSYAVICLPDGTETLSDAGYIIAGLTSLNVSTGDITVTTIDSDPMVIKHEIVHVHQINRGDISTCDKPITFYFNEVEAYFFQYMPNFIYNLKFK